MWKNLKEKIYSLFAKVNAFILVKRLKNNQKCLNIPNCQKRFFSLVKISFSIPQTIARAYNILRILMNLKSKKWDLWYLLIWTFKFNWICRL